MDTDGDEVEEMRNGGSTPFDVCFGRQSMAKQSPYNHREQLRVGLVERVHYRYRGSVIAREARSHNATYQNVSW